MKGRRRRRRFLPFRRRNNLNSLFMHGEMDIVMVDLFARCGAVWMAFGWNMFMIAVWFFVRLCLGILYPAYASYKAIRTKSPKDYVKWMMYWVVFSLFMALETVTDIFLAFWWGLGMYTWIYSLIPSEFFCGSSFVYNNNFWTNSIFHVFVSIFFTNFNKKH